MGLVSINNLIWKLINVNNGSFVMDNIQSFRKTREFTKHYLEINYWNCINEILKKTFQIINWSYINETQKNIIKMEYIKEALQTIIANTLLKFY